MFLTRPFPDELVGSVFHRAQHMLGISSKVVLFRLIGHGSRAVPSLFCADEEVALACGLSLEDFLNRHTTLPYVRSFLSAVDQTTSLRQMASETQGYGRRSSIVQYSSESERQKLRLCPICVASDLKSFGISYWHRIHQIPLVHVCPIHETWLHESPVHFRARSAPAPSMVLKNSIRLNWGRGRKEIAVAIAITSCKALNSELPIACDWKEYFHSRAEAAGYLLPHGTIYTSLLAADVQSVFGESWLARHGHSIGKLGTSWPGRLLIPSAHHVSPVRHVLMDAFFNSGAVPSHPATEWHLRRGTAIDWGHLDRSAVEKVQQCLATQTDARWGCTELLRAAGLAYAWHVHRVRLPLLTACMREFSLSDRSSPKAHVRSKASSKL